MARRKLKQMPSDSSSPGMLEGFKEVRVAEAEYF